MMRIFLVSVLLLSFSFFENANCQPKISIIGGNTIDVGTVYNTGNHIVQLFQIKNTGDKPLHINGVRTSCGCTVALLSDSLLEPGQKSKVKIDFNPEGYRGDVTKNIYVMSDDPKNQMATIQLKMIISYALLSNPNFILFPNAVVGKPDTASVMLTNNSSEVIKIIKVETDTKEISSRVDYINLKPGGSSKLQLYFLGEKAGPVYGDVTVKTTSKVQPTLMIRYYAGVGQK